MEPTHNVYYYFLAWPRSSMGIAHTKCWWLLFGREMASQSITQNRTSSQLERLFEVLFLENWNCQKTSQLKGFVTKIYLSCAFSSTIRLVILSFAWGFPLSYSAGRYSSVSPPKLLFRLTVFTSSWCGLLYPEIRLLFSDFRNLRLTRANRSICRQTEHLFYFSSLIGPRKPNNFGLSKSTWAPPKRISWKCSCLPFRPKSLFYLLACLPAIKHAR